MMAQGNTRNVIETLKGENYCNWKFRMELILEEHGVIDYVNKKLDLTELTEKVKEEKMQKDSKAKSLIVQCVDDNQIECLRGKATAFEMWETLREKYEKKGLPGQLFLRKRLLSMKLKEDESLETFLQQFEETVRLLKESGCQMTDQDLVCSILLALPKSYETVVTVLENMPNIDFNLTKKKLLSEYEKRKLTGQVEVRQQKGTYAFAALPGACYRCGEQGHYKRDCKKVFTQQHMTGHGYYRGTNRGRYRNGSGQRHFGNRGRARISNYVNNDTNISENTSDQRLDGSEDNICFMGDRENSNLCVSKEFKFFH